MISVIIPTYNRRELLLRAIDSVLKQTCAELECIVVDDASDDGTAEAVRRIADPRVRYVRQESNAGACAARNLGMALAKGTYIAFQDSDDVWDADKLEKQLALLESTGADIVACAMRRITEDGAETVFPARQPEGELSQALLLYENLCSTQCILGRADALRDVGFDPDMPRLQDWDMILRAAEKYRIYYHPEPLCDVYVQPDSISRQPKKLLTALQRLYAKYHAVINAPRHPQSAVGDGFLDARWLLSLIRAGKMCGESPWTEELLQSTPRWVYHRGDELKGQVVIHANSHGEFLPDDRMHLYLELNKFTALFGGRYLPDVLLADALRAAQGRAVFDVPPYALPACEGEQRAIRTGLTVLSAWRDWRFAWDTLTQAYGGGAVAPEMSAMYLPDMPAWARALRHAEFPAREGPVRRIGMYYHGLKNGGVQRAAAALVNLWVQMGYEVTVITAREQPPAVQPANGVSYEVRMGAAEGEYPIPAHVRHCVIPAMRPDRPECSRAHTAALADIARTLDLLVYHAWADPLVLYDLLAVKSMGCRFLVHTHSTFTMPLLETGLMDRFEALPDVYALADGVVTLSETDACYWRHANPRVYRTVNPLTFKPAETPVNALAGQTILWAGRLSEEKRPMDAIAILRQVVQAVPGAKLILLGGGNEAQMDALRRYIDAEGMGEHVELPGYCVDTAAYFRRADVFLCTSAYEGFGLAMAEAQTHGVPVVTYDMPYLTILRGGGHIAVPQGDMNAAAQAVIRLLSDGPCRRQLGAEARRNVEENLDINQQARWQSIFTDMEKAPISMPGDEADALMLRTLREHVVLSRTQPAGMAAARQTAFVPLPAKGPFKRLRKKAATFAQVLLIDGLSGVARVLRERRR